MAWTLNEKSSKTRRRRQPFGEALLEIAHGLRGLTDNLDDTLSWVASQLSVPIAKILLTNGESPLLNCIESPKLPGLHTPTALQGDPYELFEPVIFALAPPPEPNTKGTGVRIEHRGLIFPLHGMGYSKKSKSFVMHSPWDGNGPSLRLHHWRKQKLVQVNRVAETVEGVLKETRNHRGAHSDPRWIENLPQTMRDFYRLYANAFIVHVGRLLVSEAWGAAASTEFVSQVFPKHSDPRRALRCTALPDRARMTMDRLRIGSGKGWEFDYAKNPGISIRSVPHKGGGTMSDTTCLWLMRAPGPETPIERKACIDILLSPVSPTVDEIYSRAKPGRGG